MKINEEGLELIKHFEGFSPVLYLCPAGKKTIGYGHVILKNEKFPELITEKQGEELLLKDLRKFEESVKRLIKPALNKNQFSALTSFTFNLGPAALQRSSLRRKINSGYINDAPEEFLRWVFVSGKKYSGLYRRRIAEKQLFERGL